MHPRVYLAGQALSGYLAEGTRFPSIGTHAKTCVDFADAVLAELQRTCEHVCDVIMEGQWVGTCIKCGMERKG